TRTRGRLPLARLLHRAASGAHLARARPHATVWSILMTEITASFDVIRAAYAELIVSDLAASREFYVDMLGLVVTHEDDDAIYLRAFEEYLHHSLVLRKGPTPALAALAYRVRSHDDVTAAAEYFTNLGCRT